MYFVFLSVVKELNLYQTALGPEGAKVVAAGLPSVPLLKDPWLDSLRVRSEQLFNQTLMRDTCTQEQSQSNIRLRGTCARTPC